MNLFLDDQRVPTDVTWIEYPLAEWNRVKSYKEFVSFIKRNGLPNRISFDNDLTPQHYEVYFKYQSQGYIPYESYAEPGGYHCLLWLVHYCKLKKCNLPQIYIHTLNHIARQDMEELIKNYENH